MIAATLILAQSVGGQMLMLAIRATKSDENAYAVGMLLGGAVLMAIGIPLVVVGEKRRRRGVRTSLQVGPGGAGLRLSF